MRTDRYRYTRWQARQDASDIVAVEVYDHQADPAENINLAANPANRELVASLARAFEKGWRGALPE
jgi:hypothetical protein